MDKRASRRDNMKLPKHYFCLNDMTPQHEVEECIMQECESAGLDIREDEDLAEERGYDRAFEVVNPYKDKLKKVLEICKINAKGDGTQINTMVRQNLKRFVILLKIKDGIKNDTTR